MNNIVKIALAISAGGSLLYLGLRKKGKRKNLYLAPDGNTYKENQIYRTYDYKLYKNGKEFHYNLPEENNDLLNTNSAYNQAGNSVNISYKNHQKNPSYHHKGLRHQ